MLVNNVEDTEQESVGTGVVVVQLYWTEVLGPEGEDNTRNTEGPRIQGSDLNSTVQRARVWRLCGDVCEETVELALAERNLVCHREVQRSCYDISYDIQRGGPEGHRERV